MCTCRLCVGVFDIERVLTDYRHETTGHERGCECRQCRSITVWDLRDELGCEIEPGRHRFLADLYLTVIERDRCDLLRAPLWAFELARIGDNVVASKREQERKRQKRELQSNKSTGSPWPG